MDNQRVGRSTRPTGLKGSHLYRQALREQEEEEQQQPLQQHSIADARAALAARRESRAKAQEKQQEEVQLVAFDSSSTGLQQRLALRLSDQLLPVQDPSRSSETTFVRSLLNDVSRPVTSKKAEASQHSKGVKYVTNRTTQCAASLINFGGLLWEDALKKLVHLRDSGQIELLAIVKKRRYDETPSKIRVPVAGSATDSNFAKVLQSELKLSLVLKSTNDGSFVFVEGHSHTWLQAIDRNTAETIQHAQRELEGCIPRLHTLSRMFSWPISMINTDRFSANFRCERAMERANPHYTKCHYGCDHHAVCTVLGKAFGLKDPSDHISAMIAGSIVMQDANSTQSLKAALMKVISEKLRIRPGKAPRGQAWMHREAIYDVLLGPVPDLPHRTRGHEQRRSQQRFILSSFFTGDIQDPDHIDFWTLDLEPSREKILEAFWQFAIPALVPSKAPMFPRGKWTNTELAIDWYALLAAHNSLLGPAVQQWLGGPAKGDPVGSNAETVNYNAGWLSCLTDPVTDQPQSRLQPLQNFNEDDAQEGPVPVQAESELNVDKGKDPKTDWTEKRKQFKNRFQLWAATSPIGFLVAMRISISPAVHLTYSLLSLVGDNWEKKQQTKLLEGSPRSFPALEASRQKPLANFFVGMHEAFHKENYALPSHCWTRKLQVLLFRMMSCITASMTLHLQARWQSYPVRLFRVLDGFDDSRAVAECRSLLDPLAAEFWNRYPTHALRTSEEAIAILTATCASFTSGIAEIEARHASTRRLAHIKGCQTNVPTLTDVSASWTARRNASMRQSTCLFSEGPSKSQGNQEGQTQESDARSGGPWHAFLSERLMGRRLVDVMDELKQEYRDLTPAEFARFVEIGRLGRLSAQRGFKAFKPISASASGLAMRPDLLEQQVARFSAHQIVASPPNDSQSLRNQLACRKALAKQQRQSEIAAEASVKDQIAEFKSSMPPSAVSNVFGARDSTSWQWCLNMLPSMQHARVHVPADLLTEACCEI